MESRETKLCNKLYKPGKEQQIFLDFRIFETRQKETTKIFLDFSNIKLKIEDEANQY
jgi:hypothetical protein